MKRLLKWSMRRDCIASKNLEIFDYSSKKSKERKKSSEDFCKFSTSIMKTECQIILKIQLKQMEQLIKLFWSLKCKHLKEIWVYLKKIKCLYLRIWSISYSIPCFIHRCSIGLSIISSTSIWSKKSLKKLQHTLKVLYNSKMVKLHFTLHVKVDLKMVLKKFWTNGRNEKCKIKSNEYQCIDKLKSTQMLLTKASATFSVENSTKSSQSNSNNSWLM